MMEETKKKNAQELDDDALESAAGGAGGLGRGGSTTRPGSNKTQTEIDDKQNNDN